jgi:hypothetical protein
MPFPSLRAKRSNPEAPREKTDCFVASLLAMTKFKRSDFMRRSFLMLAIVAAALWAVPASAQSNAQLGPLCTSENTPADKQIDACNKIIALKVFAGEKLATIYFWRAVGWNKKGDYARVIADTTQALRLTPN